MSSPRFSLLVTSPLSIAPPDILQEGGTGHSLVQIAYMDNPVGRGFVVAVSLKAQTHGAPVDLPASHIYDLGIRGATGGRGAALCMQIY